jgi:hypothetical protein
MRRSNENPQNSNNDAEITLMITFLDNVTVPDVEVVGFPAYRVAKIFQTSESGQLGSSLNMVRTLSGDNTDQVVDFYKENIPSDWDCKKFIGIHYVWKGDEIKAMMV